MVSKANNSLISKKVKCNIFLLIFYFFKFKFTLINLKVFLNKD